MYSVEETSPFKEFCKSYPRHKKLSNDLIWLKDKLSQAPLYMGDRVPGLQGLKHPVYKARLKDSCCRIGQSGGWRVYYAVDSNGKQVYLLFFHHKREYENPGVQFLEKKIERAFSEI